MRYLIDGNNLIGHEGGPSPANDDGRDRLVRCLCAVARRTRKAILVVFDGAAPDGRKDSHLGGVRVLYAGAGRSAMSADQRILGLLEREGRPADVTVVTSDQSLANRARALGAATLRCHEFRPLLRRCEDEAAAGPEKPAHVDVGDWAAYFGIDPASE
jgi:predicted RNA-binding protein with PIN domain